MRLKKDSLLTRIILLNNLSLILATIVLLSIVSFFLFTSLNSEMIQDSLEKSSVIELKFKELLDEMDSSGDTLSHGIKTESISEFETLDAWEKKVVEDGVFSFFPIKYRENLHFRVIKKENGVYQRISRYGDETIEASEQIQALLNEEIIHSGLLREENGVLSYLIVKPIAKDLGILVEFRIEKNVFDNLIRENIFGNMTKLGYVSGSKYVYGNFSGEVNSELIDFNTKSIERGEKKYLFNSKTIGENQYLLTFLPLKNFENNSVGYLLVGTSEMRMKNLRMITFMFILLSSFLLMGLNTYIFTKIFSLELEPLNQLSRISKKIATGKYEKMVFPDSSLFEIKNLSNALKEQFQSIGQFKKELSSQNKVLKNTLSKINTLESIITKLRLSSEEDDVLESVMSGLTSHWGLNFNRGIFFKYVPGQIQLVGSKVYFNKYYWDKLLKSGKDRRDTFTEVVPLIKINLEKNIFADAIFEDRIVYFNEKGYLHDFGSDLMKGFTINNFAIIPVYRGKIIFGAILVDNFLKNSKITKEDLDIFNVLKLNLEITLKNRRLESVRDEDRKEGMVNRIINKYLANRHGYVERSYDLLKDIRNGKNVTKEAAILELEAFEIFQTEKLIFDYSSNKVMNFKRINITDLVRKKSEEIGEFFKNVECYFYGNENFFSLGDEESLKRVFHEIFEDSVQSIPAGKKDGEIRTVISNNGDLIEIKISDNGHGMSKKYIENHLFEPFISEKKDHIGLGLSMVNKIIKRHNGRVSVESKQGQGTTIIVYLKREERNV